MYVDPAFGGMLLQVIVGIIAVGGALVYTLRRKIRSLFTKDSDAKRKKRETTDEMVDMLAGKDEKDGGS